MRIKNSNTEKSEIMKYHRVIKKFFDDNKVFLKQISEMKEDLKNNENEMEESEKEQKFNKIKDLEDTFKEEQKSLFNDLFKNLDTNDFDKEEKIQIKQILNSVIEDKLISNSDIALLLNDKLDVSLSSFKTENETNYSKNNDIKKNKLDKSIHLIIQSEGFQKIRQLIDESHREGNVKVKSKMISNLTDYLDRSFKKDPFMSNYIKNELLNTLGDKNKNTDLENQVLTNPEHIQKMKDFEKYMSSFNSQNNNNINNINKEIEMGGLSFS